MLGEMDRNGVDQAVLICARIEHNPGNNDYVRDVVHRHPDRFYTVRRRRLLLVGHLPRARSCRTAARGGGAL